MKSLKKLKIYFLNKNNIFKITRESSLEPVHMFGSASKNVLASQKHSRTYRTPQYFSR
jgi:hypothetical protein